MSNDVDRHVGRLRRKILRRGGIAAAAVLLVIAGTWIGFAGGRSARTDGITTCGRQLCYQVEPWPLAAGTVYHGLDEPDNAVAAVEALNLAPVPVVGQLVVQLAVNDVPGQRLWGGAELSPSRGRTEQNAASGGPGDIGQLFVGEEEPGPVGVATHDLVNA